MTNIIVNLKYDGIHRWKDCNIDAVSFLKNKHRHIFHITAKKNVSHDNRDIEIIMFKRKIIAYLEKTYPHSDIGNKSCEMLCHELMKEFDLSYCSVLEDGENGAEIIK